MAALPWNYDLVENGTIAEGDKVWLDHNWYMAKHIGENVRMYKAVIRESKVEKVEVTPAMRDLAVKYPAPCTIHQILDFLLVHGVKIGGIYKHYKGVEYQVTSITRDCDNWEEFIVNYVETKDTNHAASRKLKQFLGDVYNPTYSGPRFTLVG